MIQPFLILKESGESGRFFDVLQKRSVADNVLLNPLLLWRLEVVEVRGVYTGRKRVMTADQVELVRRRLAGG